MNLELFKRSLERAEGRVPHLYLCSRGRVTVGIGHQVRNVQDAMQLELTPREAIAGDYQAVGGSKPAMRREYYSELTTARMTDTAIDALLDVDVLTFVDQVTAKIPELPALPDPAARALCDMAFNLGLGKLGEYHNLLAAVAAHDWARAAAECHRRGISEQRNRETAALFLAAA